MMIAYSPMYPSVRTRTGRKRWFPTSTTCSTPLWAPPESYPAAGKSEKSVPPSRRMRSIASQPSGIAYRVIEP